MAKLDEICRVVRLYVQNPTHRLTSDYGLGILTDRDVIDFRVHEKSWK